MRTVDTDRDEVNTTSVSTLSNVSLQEEITPYSDEVSPLFHAGDAHFLVVLTSD